MPWPPVGGMHVPARSGTSTVDPHTRNRRSKPNPLVLVKRRSGWERDSAKSDPAYRIRARWRPSSASTARSSLSSRPRQPRSARPPRWRKELEADDPKCAALVALATSRLDQAHPLVDVLRRGVGFHHAALPGDIQAELEDGTRRGPLRYLVVPIAGTVAFRFVDQADPVVVPARS